jgi:hypothetical protein
MADWFDRQEAEMVEDGSLTLVPITSPLVSFEYEGIAVKYVVNALWCKVTAGLNGRAVFSSERVSGDLFASAAFWEPAIPPPFP